MTAVSRCIHSAVVTELVMYLCRLPPHHVYQPHLLNQGHQTGLAHITLNSLSGDVLEGFVVLMDKRLRVLVQRSLQRFIDRRLVLLRCPLKRYGEEVNRYLNLEEPFAYEHKCISTCRSLAPRHQTIAVCLGGRPIVPPPEGEPYPRTSTLS